MSYIPPKPDESGQPSRPPPPAAPAQNESGTHQKVGPSPEDVRFINEMSAASLLGELDGEELQRVLTETQTQSGTARHLDLMFAYYGAAGDPLAAQRRRAADRYFLLTEHDAVSAKMIAERLAGLCPEISDMNLERIGSDDGPLVLRSGDHVIGIVDEYEEGLDTDEIDLRGLDAAQTVTVQAMVQAVNTILDRVGDERRFVPILADDSREAYVAVTVDGAIDLCRAGYLELDTKDEVYEHCAFDKP